MSKQKPEAPTGMLLPVLIDQLLEKKTGNKEFALYYLSPSWVAEIGNTSEDLDMGQAESEFIAQGETAEEAVGALLQKVA